MLTGSDRAGIADDLVASLVADLLGVECGDETVVARLRAGEFTLGEGGAA